MHPQTFLLYSKETEFRNNLSHQNIGRVILKIYRKTPSANHDHGEIFYTLKEARIVIGEWRRHYNAVQPHSVVG